MNQTDGQIRMAITARAAEWFAAQRGGVLGERECAEFFAWLKSSPLHIEEYLAVAAIERDLEAAAADSTLSLDALRELARSDNASTVTALPSAAPIMSRASALARRPERRGWRVAAWGAVAAAAVGMGWGVLGHSWLRVAKTYQTVHGSQGVWRLPDGSTLHLNTESALITHFSATERRVDIVHGQALFEVAHDAKRPFRVVAGTTNTIAVGTEFDIYHRVDTTLITVVQGQVAVFAAGGDAADATSLAAAHALRVGAGQQLRVSAGRLPEAPMAADLHQAEAWLQRQIVFKQRPLGEVAAEFNRYNELPITIADPALRALPVSGVFNTDDLDSFVAFLRSLDGVRVEQLATGIRVSRSPAPRGASQ
jgi:transmembrane sensor